jgi:predicted DNA-binding transcriptional regulator YafY
MEALLRHWNMLQLIPRHPARISTSEIERRLRLRGFATSRRTIQRDLNALSGAFPLACDGYKPSGWSWQQEAPPFDIPGMDPRTALTFKMAHDFLGRMLPPSCLEYLSPHVRQADGILQKLSDSGFGVWPDKVCAVTKNQPLLAPKMDISVLSVVYDALLHNRQIEAVYRRRGEQHQSRYAINPLGLIFADQIIYMACTLWDYTDVLTLTLHRMDSATLLETPCRIPAGFSLKKHLDNGAIGFLRKETNIPLRALFEREVALHLYETPLSADQQLTEQPDGKILVEASVADTAQLRWWLLGFGDGVEVIAPGLLRQEFQEVARQMAAKYCAPTNCQGENHS